MGPWLCPVAYVSKRLDSMASGWPPCLRALAATALLVNKADKLTLGQTLNVKVPHSLVALMNNSGYKWITNTRMTHYQGLLCKNPRVHLETVRTLNPDTYLPEGDTQPDHGCEKIIEEVHASRPDLSNKPLQNPDLEFFTDGSSYVQDGQR